jgi:hypothetical protein
MYFKPPPCAIVVKSETGTMTLPLKALLLPATAARLTGILSGCGVRTVPYGPRRIYTKLTLTVLGSSDPALLVTVTGITMSFPKKAWDGNGVAWIESDEADAAETVAEALMAKLPCVANDPHPGALAPVVNNMRRPISL